MIKNTLIVIVFILFSYKTYSQINLVPNPSFEMHDTCPTNQSQTRYAVGWSIYRLIAPYYNTCDVPSYIYDPSSAGVPANGAGYQYAFDGQGYISLWAYIQQASDNRSAAGCQLTTTLTIGTKYYVSFMASLSAIDSSYNYNTATDHLGALFSTVPYNANNPSPKNNYAQVYGTTIITDTVNWIKIAGSFVADSAYKYIAIGNFFDNAHTNTHFFYTGNSVGDSSAAYFIDMICVSTDSLLCNPALLIQSYKNSNVNIYPNPANAYFTIKTDDVMQLTIYNNIGEKMAEQKLVTGNNTISTKNYAGGIYFLEIKNTNQEVIREKIIINN